MFTTTLHLPALAYDSFNAWCEKKGHVKDALFNDMARWFFELRHLKQELIIVHYSNDGEKELTINLDKVFAEKIKKIAKAFNSNMDTIVFTMFSFYLVYRKIFNFASFDYMKFASVCPGS